MTRRKHLGALLVALLAIGCATAPLPEQPATRLKPRPKAEAAPVDGLGATDRAGYRLLAETTFPAPIASVEATSTRPGGWFDVSNVTDGRLTSAWGPASCGSPPALTFHLAGTYAINALGLKLSLGQTSSPSNHRVFVDVYTSDDGGATWEVAATDINPDETVLGSFSFPSQTANAVRLQFDAPAANLCDLLVCFANIIDPIAPTPVGTPGPQATLTPEPQATLTPEPQATLTPEPQATPTPEPQPTPTPGPQATPSPTGIGGVGATECGPYSSYTPGAWGAPPNGANAGALLHTHWSAIAGNDGTVTVGIGNTLTFTSAQAITDFLPCNGRGRTIPASTTDPAPKSIKSTLISHTLALKLEVLAGGLNGSSDLAPVVYTGGGALNGWTIGQILQLSESYIGGATPTLPGPMTASDLISIVASINLFFEPNGRPDGQTFTCPSN